MYVCARVREEGRGEEKRCGRGGGDDGFLNVFESVQFFLIVIVVFQECFGYVFSVFGRVFGGCVGECVSV